MKQHTDQTPEDEDTDECEHCGGEHDSDDCDMVDVYCAHCREWIENCGCEDLGLPEHHITPADLKELERKFPKRALDDD